MTLRNFSSTAAQTTLSNSVDGSANTLTVSATTGFPVTPFILAVDAGAAGQELVLVTNVAGTTLTVSRGYDSTVAVAHDTGAVVAHSHGAIDFREANSHVNATSGVHGVTGDLVGTSGAQTLTNKTLNSATISSPTITSPTVTGSLANVGGAWTTWTPSFLGGMTAGNGTFAGRYVQIGKTVHFHARFTLGSTSAVTGVIIGSLPVNAVSSQWTYSGLSAHLVDTSSNDYEAWCRQTQVNGVSIYAIGTGGIYGSVYPFTLGNGDYVEWRGTYEAA